MKTNQYVGQIVVMTKLTYDQSQPHCDSGEYICINQSNRILFCVSTGTPYDSTQIMPFALTGTHPWTVDPRGYNSEFISDIIDRLYEFRNNRHAIKPEYCQSVYDRIPSIIEKLEAAAEVARTEEEFEERMNDLHNKLLSLADLCPCGEQALGPVGVSGFPEFTMTHVPWTVGEVFDFMRQDKLPPFEGKQLTSGKKDPFSGNEDHNETHNPDAFLTGIFNYLVSLENLNKEV